MYLATSAEEAVKIIKSNDRVYIQAAAAAPQLLINAMSDKHEELRNVEVCHLHLEGETPYANPELRNSFHVNSFFIGHNVRHTLTAGNGSYTPVFLSELPLLFKRNIVALDVAMIHVSVPDKHGYCSLGVSIEATLAAIANAKVVIAQVNKQMPRTHGDGLIHISEINSFVECDIPLPTLNFDAPSETENKIANFIANLIEDRSTLQMGIGNIPNAVLSKLIHHKDLGLHTEMFSDGVIDLILNDVITGNYKSINPGRTLATFLMGSKRLYDYVDDNPFIEMRASDYVNDVSVIKQNRHMIAINSAIEVDVTGQVCADSIGAKMYSGVGGQMDFIRAASLSEGGKAIIALPSITKKGVSRIVPTLNPGAGVVTTRSHVHFVVTEYGVANLYGKTIKERVKALTDIAHPNHREYIDKTYFELIH
ncbi:MAG: acetyl-CoA hydrolase/transferase C-terminal domain-containing protein [Flavobacteriaceae bacterium]|jgi:acyl-CoA hydrolase|nr:4-hydroxybutyrate CoA-transferase [Flavobacteriaceae bacterium]MCP4801679.1 acetyl-CoA hydrolase/transferase family protein [Bacteroidota bacterium]MDA7567930.1 4-hydroxybutyrate CoA-transferase [Flavobacteriaceae bacterium]MDG1379632.1 acetyl-CoA hydrolase/transferase C-terminal domain-containing protein [Flavobacteriaceae bacterium]MDG2349819.1 acetyl-CoA hydrolase/transferase C-terminal domain-containing protein [Flavobacteriaceae bacterium]|tara:strand:- start:2180 stop:3448 length:1269 start_codon:yes stop_codon:yes gene_type:complete